MPSTARRSYRLAALGTSIACFVLSIIVWAWSETDGSRAALVCLTVGFIMLVIYSTGTWPPRRQKG